MKNEYPPLDKLINTIIPGDGRWPSAAEAIAEPSAMLDAFDILERQTILALSLELAGLSKAERICAFARFESASNELCRKLIARLMRDYYQSPAAHARVIALAEAGPREASPFFDESQLTRMRARSRPNVPADRRRR